MHVLNTDVCMCVRLNSQLYDTKVGMCVYDFFLIIIRDLNPFKASRKTIKY